MNNPALDTRSVETPVGHRERPILFSGPMVRAIIDGRKTQTRRVVKERDLDAMEGKMLADFEAHNWCPYGRIGDRLWVRETFSLCESRRAPDDMPAPIYRATSEAETITWKPSIFMPRWASRITLEVTDVRVERLQSMSYYDWCADFCPNAREREDALATFVGSDNQQKMAAAFWDAINGKRAPWASNPWVWVVGFQKVPNTSFRSGE